MLTLGQSNLFLSIRSWMFFLLSQCVHNVSLVLTRSTVSGSMANSNSFTCHLALPGTDGRFQPQHQQHGLGTRLHSAPCLQEVGNIARQKIRKQHSDPVGIPQGGFMALRPLHSSPRLSELMQRSPLPTILGSPSRVRPLCSF